MAVKNGTNRNDTLIGDNGNDTLRGNGGDDILYAQVSDQSDPFDSVNRLEGGAGNDKLFGGSGINTLLGGNGNDEILGGTGDSFLIGGNGNDTLTSGNTRIESRGVNDLTGVDPAVSRPGRGEVDTLIGGIFGKDIFRLGDSRKVFYDDGNRSTAGDKDYASIFSFDGSEDEIVLKGDASQYSFSRVGFIGGVTTISFNSGRAGEVSEIIAYVQGDPLVLSGPNANVTFV